MKSILKTCGAASLVLAVVGCGAAQPPRELVNARTAYQRASQSPNASLAPVQLHEAHQALARAEKQFDDEGNAASTRDLGYIAQRKALSANAAADAQRAMNDKAMALNQYEQAKQQHAMIVQQQLERQKSQLSEAQGQIESQRQARVAADERTKEALSKIAGLETRMTDRGLTITLSGSVLFATGKSMLMPTAQKRLEGVAEALKEDQRPLLVVGHTDSTGSDETNMKLSKQRAEAVKKYLVRNGIDESRVETQGAGENEPIASNDSPEGRANNRRVEITIEEKSSAGSKGSDSTNQTEQQKQMQQEQQQKR